MQMHSGAKTPRPLSDQKSLSHNLENGSRNALINRCSVCSSEVTIAALRQRRSMHPVVDLSESSENLTILRMRKVDEGQG